MRRRSTGSIIVGLATAVTLIVFSGCEQTLDDPAAAETTPVSDMGGGGGDSTSTYGKARDTAEGVVDDLQKRDEDLQDLIDETTKTP